MSIILSVNAGSSSFKFKMFKMPEEIVVAKGLFERIGLDQSNYEIETNEFKISEEVHLNDHQDAVLILIKKLIELKVVDSLEDIAGIGHRVVHGGEEFDKAVLIDNEVVEKIKDLSSLAPLHNPANLMGVNSFIEVVENAKQVAVFDTAFHQTMPRESYIYPTPYEWYEKYGVRKYGFHGTSHKYVSRRCAELLSKDVSGTNVITVHVGNGVSLCAVQAGKSIDTTMGFTPLAGVSMGTRSGDLDPAIIEYIAEKENRSIKEVLSMLNKQSGYLGVSGHSSDMRDIDEYIKKGDERSKLALDIQTRKISMYIAAYSVYMKGVDAICFTAGVGENYAKLRKDVCDRLEYLGVSISSDLNGLPKSERLISDENSLIKVFIIPTDEELEIARETYLLL